MNRLRGYALTFDDVLLVPRHASLHPKDVEVHSKFTRAIPLNVPIVSAAMDTVTEASMAIEIARVGGIGVIHKNMPIDRQAAEVDRVKRSERGMILNTRMYPGTGWWVWTVRSSLKGRGRDVSQRFVHLIRSV